MNELTIEQALQNIAIVLDKYVGTKQEHIILEQSFNLVKSTSLPTIEVVEDEK
jgi:predicted RNase H-like HicB family nuclease